jgi:hypothetical protein
MFLFPYIKQLFTKVSRNHIGFSLLSIMFFWHVGYKFHFNNIFVEISKILHCKMNSMNNEQDRIWSNLLLHYR